MADVRLIDANALAKWLDKEHYVDRPAGKCDERQNRVLGIAISALKNPQIAPTIDAAPVVHAYWYGSEFDGYADGNPVYDTWGCSHCHEEVSAEGFPPAYNYCPYCGAKMDAQDMDVPTKDGGAEG